MHDQQTMRLANAFPNQIGHLAVHRFFLNIQCVAQDAPVFQNSNVAPK